MAMQLVIILEAYRSAARQVVHNQESWRIYGQHLQS